MTTECRILIGDVRARLAELPDESVQCVVTSPPYWGLRDYGTEPQVWGGRAGCAHEWFPLGSRRRGGKQGEPEARYGRDVSAQLQRIPAGEFCGRCQAWRGQLGLEPTVAQFIEHMTELFLDVRRVLRADGTCWVNMGDCYAGPQTGGFKPKDLVPQSWLLALALQKRGWWLRQDIVWEKPNPMPESIRDRCTKAHEYLFLLTKGPRYYYDAEAIKEPVSGTANPRGSGVNPKSKVAIQAGWDTSKGEGGHGTIHKLGARPRQNASFSAAVRGLVEKRNPRSVWRIASEPYSQAHYATFPTALPRRCILAGTRPGDTVLDPFAGSGTTGAVANALGRNAILIDLDPKNEALMRARLAKPLLARKAKKARACASLLLPLEGVA